MKSTAIRKQCQSRKGFTLVELVTVIAVMAILAAVVLPAFTTLRKKAQEEELQAYYANVKVQAAAIVDAYNEALNKGETPRFAGRNISTARGMQECLRLANNHTELYDIVVTTVADEPNPNLYNHQDTIVICVQFLGLTIDKQDILITNSNGSPCSPEFSDKNISPVRCRLGLGNGTNAFWYVGAEDNAVKTGEGW